MQNKMLQNSICDSERSEIPKDFFGKLREDPCAAGGKRPAAQGRPRRLACPGCQKPREGRRGKGGRFRYPRGPASWPARVPTLGCPSPYICLQKRIPDRFFQKNFSTDAIKIYLQAIRRLKYTKTKPRHQTDAPVLRFCVFHIIRMQIQ